MLYLFLARERPASTDMQRFARKKTVCGEQIFVYLFTALFLIDSSSRTQFFLAEKQSGFRNKKLKSTFIQDRVAVLVNLTGRFSSTYNFNMTISPVDVVFKYFKRPSWFKEMTPS